MKILFRIHLYGDNTIYTHEIEIDKEDFRVASNIVWDRWVEGSQRWITFGEDGAIERCYPISSIAHIEISEVKEVKP